MPLRDVAPVAGGRSGACRRRSRSGPAAPSYSTMALSLATLATLVLAGAGPAAPFALEDGDRVVFVGGGFFEQERLHGRLETRLTARFPDAQITFRNLGWGGDTVRGVARTAGFQSPDGLARLVKDVGDLRPTVLLVGYGMNESFDGPGGLDAFVADYEKLLARVATPRTRVVLLSPTYHEDLGRPLPDPAGHNRDLGQYTAAVRKLAAKGGHAFVDLFHPLASAKADHPAWRLTTNGIHLADAGSALVAAAVIEQLGLAPRPWRLELDATGKVRAREGTAVDMVKAGNGLQFQTLDALLPATAAGPVPGDVQTLRVTGLLPGDHVLSIDGAEVRRATAAEWDKGVALTGGPAFRDAEALRAAVLYKDQLFYRRWRPFNDHSRHWDFLRGDYALYDADIAAAERAVAKARRPRPHLYQLVPGPRP